MKFRTVRESVIPEADLIPMLNVMLGVLAFFVILSMTLTTQKVIKLQLPPEVDAEQPYDFSEIDTSRPLLVELDLEGNLVIEQSTLTEDLLKDQVTYFLVNNSEDSVFFKPDPQVSFEKILQTLALLKQIGNDRISLVIDELPQADP
ncbi:ExbD/TolR family protein [Lyngbya confervoides]|uniref:Biopolymer transporter ExbD n=1 Tax=Lyngbya confervoides BDU141951 TaxID=1574623 RepID=A0ABD4TA72_9CYAN|nr:biopolymer transporter ExbD [Lyngbya confervoides]MCM1985264.1 biopolymer transporter ExbD [Lyngbya confervoides BDU141951]